MGWDETSDAEVFWRATAGFLRARRIELTVPISVVDTLRSNGSSSPSPARLAWFRGVEDGEVGAILIETPPHRPVVSTMPATAVAELTALRERPARVLGPVPTVQALAAAWGARVDDGISERLHRLDRLSPPTAPTTTRVAGLADAPAVWDAVREFHREATPQDPPPRRSMVEAGLVGRRYLLAVVEDVPVALAAVTPTVLGVARIGPVYTWPGHRGRGHGASVTVAAARLARERNAEEILLFTDLANRTSNALYARLGFVGIGDHVDAALVPVATVTDLRPRRCAPV